MLFNSRWAVAPVTYVYKQLDPDLPLFGEVFFKKIGQIVAPSMESIIELARRCKDLVVR